MPYITQDKRDLYDSDIDGLGTALEVEDNDPGHLNYIISELIGRVWNKERRYKTICMIVGTLVCVAFEFYRRVAAGYEDKAVAKNGDIFEYYHASCADKGWVNKT